jgi:hypothetical protein
MYQTQWDTQNREESKGVSVYYELTVKLVMISTIAHTLDFWN